MLNRGMGCSANGMMVGGNVELVRTRGIYAHPTGSRPICREGWTGNGLGKKTPETLLHRPAPIVGLFEEQGQTASKSRFEACITAGTPAMYGRGKGCRAV